MTRLMQVFFLVFAMLIVSGCGGGDPTDIAEGFLRAVEAGNTDRATQYIAPEGRDDAEMMVMKIRMAISEADGIDSINVIDTRIGETSGEVRVRLEFGNGDSQEITFDMVQADGRWYIGDLR